MWGKGPGAWRIQWKIYCVKILSQWVYFQKGWGETCPPVPSGLMPLLVLNISISRLPWYLASLVNFTILAFTYYLTGASSPLTIWTNVLPRTNEITFCVVHRSFVCRTHISKILVSDWYGLLLRSEISNISNISC